MLSGDAIAVADRVYRLKGLSGLVTSVGRGQITWDRLATDAANKRQLVPVASGGGSVDQHGNTGASSPMKLKRRPTLSTPSSPTIPRRRI